MKQNIKSIIIATGGIIGVATSVFFLTFVVLAWTGPQHTPPACESGEVGCDVVIHTGTAGQSKAGGLLLNSGGAEYGLIVENGNVGIGTTTPTAKLEVNGTIETTALSGAWDVSDSNYVRIGNLQIAWGETQTNSISGPSYFTTNITFPIAFLQAPTLTATYENGSYADITNKYMFISTISETNAIIKGYISSSGSRSYKTHWIAIGRWQ